MGLSVDGNIFPLPFWKMSGTGNDFVFIDHRVPRIPEEDQAEFARLVCRRMFSVGADGVMLIEPSDTADFRWRFYNSDGSLGEMCGNGSRCAARFAFENGIVDSPKMRFETLAGIIEAELLEDDDDKSVRVQMTPPFGLRVGMMAEVDGQLFELSFLNTGVPHAVVFVDKPDCDVQKWGRILRFHPLFAPAGANVNFVHLLDTGELQVRTYERGVEDETRACGTGAVASSIIAVLHKMVTSPVNVVTSGGDRLTVSFELRGSGVADRVFLTGPTRLVYTGEITAESLL